MSGLVIYQVAAAKAQKEEYKLRRLEHPVLMGAVTEAVVEQTALTRPMEGLEVRQVVEVVAVLEGTEVIVAQVQARQVQTGQLEFIHGR